MNMKKPWETDGVLWIPTPTFTGRLRARVFLKDAAAVAGLLARAVARGEPRLDAWVAGPPPSSKAYTARAEMALAAALPDGRAVVWLAEGIAHRATPAKAARRCLGDWAAEAFDRRLGEDRRVAARRRIVEAARAVLENPPA